MKTIIHNYGKIPEEYFYQHGTPCELDEYDLHDIARLEIDEVWYWYAYGSYEGSGCILMRKGDLYDVGGLHHCSCNGPTDTISFNGVPLEELKSSLSQDYNKEAMCLFNMAEKAILENGTKLE